MAYRPAVDYRNRITIEPGKRSGKPCIRGLRITVSDVLDYLAGGMSEDAVWSGTGIVYSRLVDASGERASTHALLTLARPNHPRSTCF